MTTTFVDIETNLKHNKIWLAVTKEANEDQCQHYRQEYSMAIRNLKNQISGSKSVVAHNLIGFDAPILRAVWGVPVAKSQAVDTLVMSRLHNPVIEGGHSLKAWGKRLGEEKMEFDITDFDAGWTHEMSQYCERDVVVLERLYNHLVEEFKQWPDQGKQSLELEHETAIVLSRMERTGFKINQEKASDMEAEVINEMDAIETQLQTVFPPIIEERVSLKTGKRLKDKVTVFNAGSRKQIAERLQGLGVDFDKLTDKGNIIIDDLVLNEIDLPEAKLLARYFWLQKRNGMLKGWRQATKANGRVHGRINSIGAVTGRCTHSKPNMAQIPSDKEYRSLWTVEDGRVLVGADLSGIELRCLAHYMQDPVYTKELLEGDIHTANQKAAGLPTRDSAKTFIYALLYGAGPAKIGSIVDGDAQTGKTLINKFMRAIPQAKKLIDKVKRLGAKGTIPALDGRYIQVRSEHSSLNMLLQSAGAIVAKQWLVTLNKKLAKEKLDAKMVAFVHDEIQIDCLEAHAPRVAELAIEAAKEAGEILNFRVPVAAEAKIGKTWAQTH